VYVGVFLHVGLLVEALAAELARVRARVGVDQQVRAERRRPLETLTALHARERTQRRSRRATATSSISASAYGRPLSPPS